MVVDHGHCPVDFPTTVDRVGKYLYTVPGHTGEAEHTFTVKPLHDLIVGDDRV